MKIIKTALVTLIMLLSSTTALAQTVEGVLFPDHFRIPPITENKNMRKGVDGLYFPRTDRVEVRSLSDIYAISHEVGHSILRDAKFPTCDGHITLYAKTNIEEDKAESFAYFMLFRWHFRRMATLNPCIMKKYRVVYRVFYPLNPPVFR